MKTKILKIERVKETTLPPGVYTGEWSGYEIVLKKDNGTIRLRTETGIRGWCKAVVTVSDTGDIDIAT